MQKEESYMIIIPRKDQDFSLGTVMERIKQSDRIIYKASSDKGDYMDIVAEVDGRDVRFVIENTDVELPPFIRKVHNFTEEEFEAMESAKRGLAMSMTYTDEPMKNYYEQLVIINVLLPGMLAVMDCPSEKVLLGDWVTMAAESKVYPSPSYIFTVQAVNDKKTVWFHSHGLKRCGMPELEILESDMDHMNEHYKVIETFAVRMLENGKAFEEGEAVYIGNLSDGDVLMCAMLNWRDALKYYPLAKMGGKHDRDDYHSVDTNVIMTFSNPKDEENKKYTKIQKYDKSIVNNPMFMISTSETNRMAMLARERVDYLKKIMASEGGQALVKLGLVTAEEYRDRSEREHIWFEVLEIGENSITAKLTQEPYYIPGLHTGDVGKYGFDEITDWIALYKEQRITPDNTYLINRS